jgi:NAD(P)-dependent dehydrogenase (short-subunit alcohol dehydrogenase family)
MTSKIALITGAGSGIGRAAAIGFAQAGYGVALLGRRPEPLAALAREIGEAALALPTDVGRSDEVRAAFEAATQRFGRLDVLFNNAGTGAKAALIDAYADEDWERVVRTNLTGAFYCAREAFRLMRAQTPQGGRIINNGSVSAQAPRPGSIAYTATKHALTGLTKSLSLDGRPFRIACGQIDIGNAETEMVAPMKAGVPQANGEIRSEPVMAVADVVRALLYMAELPLEANVQFMTVMATNMPLIGRG